MKKYTIHQAKSQLSKLIQQALNGDTVIIANRAKPLVRLQAIQQGTRKTGFLKGKIVVSPDFDAIPPEFKKYVK